MKKLKLEKSKDEGKNVNNIIIIIKGSAIALIFTIAMLLILSILLTYTSLKESIATPVILTITGISIIIGSMISSRKVRKNGILNGCTVGFIYILTIYLLSSLFVTGFVGFSWYSFITVVVAVLTGAIGGILRSKFCNCLKNKKSSLIKKSFCYISLI